MISQPTGKRWLVDPGLVEYHSRKMFVWQTSGQSGACHMHSPSLFLPILVEQIFLRHALTSGWRDPFREHLVEFFEKHAIRVASRVALHACWTT